MQTLKWLLKREFWENRGLLFWSNCIVSCLMIIFCIVASFKADHLFEDATPTGAMQVAGGSAIISMLLFGMVMIFPLYSYVLGALSDERKDRSILFWKSLPVSDEKTILAKVVFAVAVFPLVTICCSVLTNYLCLLIICLGHAFRGVNMFAAVLLYSDLWKPAYNMVINWPVYALWCLPTVGWLLLMSGLLTQRVGLWAVLGPVGLLLLTGWANHLFGLHLELRDFAYCIVGRLLFSLVPLSWLMSAAIVRPNGRETLNRLVDSANSEHWRQLQDWDIWIGAAIGMVMILAAIKIRRWRE